MRFFVEHLSQLGVLSLASKNRENPGDEVVLVGHEGPYDPTTGDANENVAEKLTSRSLNFFRRYTKSASYLMAGTEERDLRPRSERDSSLSPCISRSQVN